MTDKFSSWPETFAVLAEAQCENRILHWTILPKNLACSRPAALELFSPNSTKLTNHPTNVRCISYASTLLDNRKCINLIGIHSLDLMKSGVRLKNGVKRFEFRLSNRSLFIRKIIN